MNLSAPDILFLQNNVAIQRDTKAYRELFLYFHTPLYRFAFNMVKNAEVADEIVSDVMMNIWDMQEKLAQVEKLNLYLIRSVKNASLTYLSRKKPEHVVINESIEDILVDNNCNPEDKVLLSEMERKIELTIQSLPPQCQSVFRLIKEEGFSYKEVTSLLGISQNTVETHMRIAFKKLRLALNGPSHI